MAKETQNGSAAISGQVPLYKKPEPLSKETHSKLGLKKVDKPFEFLAETHFIPVTASEFGLVACHFPIIFAGENKTPLAVMGIRAGENLFVEDGLFQEDAYIPAFARRYPFVLAGDEANNRFVVCVDVEAEAVTDKNPDTMLFENDELSGFAKDAFDFLQQFERDRRATEAMVAKMKEMDLFEQKDMSFQGQNPDGTPGPKQKIADYFSITEDKLKTLSSGDLKELMDLGFIAAAHAHMISMSNWQVLVNKTLRKAREDDDASKKKPAKKKK